MSHPPPATEVFALVPSWTVALRSERKSAQTIDSYTTGVRLFLRWCQEQGHIPVLDRNLVKAWIVSLLDEGAQPATARARQAALKRFSWWLADEDIIDTDPLVGLKPPKLDTKVVESLSEDELRRLIAACAGKGFLERRDEAVIRLLAETGMRAGEVMALTLDDVDPIAGLATVQRGKGGKGRIAPFGPQTARAIDRYLRLRRTHRLAHTDALWLGGGGQGLGYHGLDRALKERAALAGVKGFHIHQLRHTFASRWMAARGSEGGLMAVAGWNSRSMIDRYTRYTASERAAAESRSLNLGDL